MGVGPGLHHLLTLANWFEAHTMLLQQRQGLCPHSPPPCTPSHTDSLCTFYCVPWSSGCARNPNSSVLDLDSEWSLEDLQVGLLPDPGHPFVAPSLPQPHGFPPLLSPLKPGPSGLLPDLSHYPAHLFVPSCSGMPSPNSRAPNPFLCSICLSWLNEAQSRGSWDLRR